MNAPAPASDLPAVVVEAFTTAVLTALREGAQIEAFPLDASSPRVPQAEVWATVRLNRAPPGEMSLVLDMETADQLAARYLPAGAERSPEIVDDATGEFANMIAGQVKTMLKGTPYHFTLSPPIVLRSSTSESTRSSEAQSAFCFESELGLLGLLVSLPLAPD